MACISNIHKLRLRAITTKEYTLMVYFWCVFVFAQLAVFRAFELQFEHLRRIAYIE